MWVKRWNDRFKASGFDGLSDKSKASAKPRLSPDSEARLAENIELRGSSLKTIADVRSMIEQDFGVTYSRSGAGDLLRRLGFVKLRPRPRHPGASAGRQDLFRSDDLPLFSRQRVVPIRISESKSGSKTRRALASKDV